MKISTKHIMTHIPEYQKYFIHTTGKYSLWYLLILLIVFSCACKEQPTMKNRKTSIPVKTWITQKKTVQFPVRTSGKLSKKSEIKLSFKTGGIISSIDVKEGEIIKEGQVMARLNLMEIKAKTNQARLALKKAERDYKRVQNLYQDSVATLEQYQNMQTALEVARNQLDIAQFNLEYSVIKAPADGRVLKRLVEENEIIAPGHPVFLFSSTKNAWVLRCNLSDRDVVKLKLLDTAQVFFDAYPSHIFTAEVSQIAEWADPYTGTYEVELKIKKETELLLSGFIAKALVYPSQKKSMVVIPAGALINGKGRTGFVYVVENGKPLMKKIRFSKISNDSLSVEQGLSAGEELITEGNYYIDGSSEIVIKNK